MKHGNLGSSLFIGVMCLTPQVASAVVILKQEAHLSNPSPTKAPNDRFGTSVALSDDQLVVATPKSDVVWTWGFVNGKWAAHGAIKRPQEIPSSQSFGEVVVMSGPRLAISAPWVGGSDDKGRVSFYRLDGAIWTLLATLVNPSTEGNFGLSMAMDGDLAVITNQFSVFFYRLVNDAWVLEDQIVPPAVKDMYYYINGLAVDGDLVLIGAARYEAPGTAYIYRRVGGAWELESELGHVPARDADDFGRAVDLRDGRALIGAPAATGAEMNTGAVWVFEEASGWAQTGYLYDEEGTFDDYFGGAVAWVDGFAVIGAPMFTPYGKVYLFGRDGDVWSERSSVSSPGMSSAIGTSIDADGAHVLLGMPGLDMYGAARTYNLVKLNLGHRCTDPGDCNSGYCMDGVCCDADCGDDPGDCRACSDKAGAQESGKCVPIVAGFECRPALSSCDAPETCDGAQTACPVDALHGAGHVCRVAADACDAPETCSGDHSACPADAFAPDETPCDGGTCNAGACEPAGGTTGTFPGMTSDPPTVTGDPPTSDPGGSSAADGSNSTAGGEGEGGCGCQGGKGALTGLSLLALVRRRRRRPWCSAP